MILFRFQIITASCERSLNLDEQFCRPVLPHNQIRCLHHFNLRSCNFNLYNLWQTGSNYIRREPQQYALHFIE